MALGEGSTPFHQSYRHELLDGLGDALVKARALKPVPAKKFVDAIRASGLKPVKESPAKKPVAKT